jgi:ankyrin repeat protein
MIVSKNSSQARKNNALLDAAGGKASCEYIEHLIANVGADINAQDNNGQTVLMKAIKSNRYIAVIKTLLKHGANANAASRNVTPLMYSVLKNKQQLAETLISNKVEVNTICKGISPLIYSLMKKEDSIATMLIRNGADVNAKYRDKTALMIAAKYTDNPEIIKLLIANGADTKARDRSGKTALDFAKRNNKEIISSL